MERVGTQWLTVGNGRIWVGNRKASALAWLVTYYGEYCVEKCWDNGRVKSELLLRESNLRLQYSSYSTTNKTLVFLKLFILVKRSTCFGRSFRPPSGAQHCTYGNRLMSNGCCYLLLAAGNSSSLTHACCRMCSFELLMMDGKTVRNM